MRRMLPALGLVAAIMVAAGLHALQAPPMQGAVLPANGTVGDILHAIIRIEPGPGAHIVAPDSLLLPPDVERAGTREIRVDTAGGTRRVTIRYPLTAWRPGTYRLPPVTVRLAGGGAAASVYRVSIPDFHVSSVLPADTAGVQPRAAKDVLGASRLWWPILLALLGAALAAAALRYWWRRRHRTLPPDTGTAPATLTVEAALERLEALRCAGLIERGEMKPFYEQLTTTVRRFAATANAGWGVELTTTELAARMSAGEAGEGGELLRILAGADLIKFARGSAAQDEAYRDLDAAIEWVRRIGSPRPVPAAALAGSAERRVA
jgi:hypothetical protein